MISVIIPTRNRAEYLRRALESITKQTLSSEDFEVLVVDNGSEDYTKEVILSFGDQINRLKYLYVSEPGLHAGRHTGLREATGDILVYADDDIEAFPIWLEGVKETFVEKDVALVGGKNLPKFEQNPPEWLMRMWEGGGQDNQVLGYLSILDLGDMKKDISPLYVFGCNFSIRKDVLLDAGGFHPDGMPSKLITFRGDGETHVSKHIMDSGYRAVYNPKASVYHFVPKGRMTDEYFCRRAYMQGISDSYSILRERYRVKERPPKSNSIRNILKQFKAYCKVAFNSSLEKRINRSYREGFEFHQRAADCNSELMNWVLKKDYMG